MSEGEEEIESNFGPTQIIIRRKDPRNDRYVQINDLLNQWQQNRRGSSRNQAKTKISTTFNNQSWTQSNVRDLFQASSVENLPRLDQSCSRFYPQEAATITPRQPPPREVRESWLSSERPMQARMKLLRGRRYQECLRYPDLSIDHSPFRCPRDVQEQEEEVRLVQKYLHGTREEEEELLLPQSLAEYFEQQLTQQQQRGAEIGVIRENEIFPVPEQEQRMVSSVTSEDGQKKGGGGGGRTRKLLYQYMKVNTATENKRINRIVPKRNSLVEDLSQTDQKCIDEALRRVDTLDSSDLNPHNCNDLSDAEQLDSKLICQQHIQCKQKQINEGVIYQRPLQQSIQADPQKLKKKLKQLTSQIKSKGNVYQECRFLQKSPSKAEGGLSPINLFQGHTQNVTINIFGRGKPATTAQFWNPYKKKKRFQVGKSTVVTTQKKSPKKETWGGGKWAPMVPLTFNNNAQTERGGELLLEGWKFKLDRRADEGEMRKSFFAQRNSSRFSLNKAKN